MGNGMPHLFVIWEVRAKKIFHFPELFLVDEENYRRTMLKGSQDILQGRDKTIDSHGSVARGNELPIRISLPFLRISFSVGRVLGKVE